MIDALAGEAHFLDHLSPVWTQLRDRGRFLVDEDVAAQRVLPFLVEVLSMADVRRGERWPKPDPGPGPTALLASYGDIKVGRRLGYRRFVFLEHGAGQSYGGDRRWRTHGSYAGGEDREDVALFMVPNQHSADRWSRAYPDAEVAMLGSSPKIPDLPRRAPGPGPVVAVSFHWDCHLTPETRSAFGWYAAELAAIARRFDIIGHGHPRNRDLFRRHYRRAGIPWVETFEEVCSRADVYVCDNSSTLFEFAATGRPVVTLNAPWYRRNVDHGLRFWEAERVGIVVDEPAALGDAIARALEGRPEDVEERERALDIVYPLRRTPTAEIAAGRIEDWLRRTDGASDEVEREPEDRDGPVPRRLEGDSPPA